MIIDIIRIIYSLLNIIHFSYYRADNYMFKVNNRNTRTRCEICSKLTIKTLDGDGDFI